MTYLTSSKVEAILERLGLSFRVLPSGDGIFYFCRTSDGITFDLRNDADEIRLWKFIGSAPLSKAGTRYEYRNPGYSDGFLGVEVTEDGDVSLYAVQQFQGEDSHAEDRIIRMVQGYISTVSNFNLNHFTM